MPRRLTQEQMDYIKVHINDYPRKEVAKAAGVTLHTLYKYITILGGTKIDNKLNNETIRKISDMYKTMTAREISEVTNIPQSTILGQVSKLGLKHDVETINRIRKERNKSLRSYWNKEKYASKGRKLHMQYKMDELRVLSGKPQETRLRIRKLSPKALNAKMYLRKSYNISTLRVSLLFSAMTPRQKDTLKRNTILKNLVSSLCVLNFRLHFSFAFIVFCKRNLQTSLCFSCIRKCDITSYHFNLLIISD